MKKVVIFLGGGILLVIVLFGWWVSNPDRGTTGLVSTHFHWLGPNDNIAVHGFEDPKSWA